MTMTSYIFTIHKTTNDKLEMALIKEICSSFGINISIIASCNALSTMLKLSAKRIIASCHLFYRMLED